MAFSSYFRPSRALGIAALLLTGCAQMATGDAITTGTYEAMATVTYTWQVEYTDLPDRPKDMRRETFASTSLVNRNGIKPDGAVTGPDDDGLYWPALPPRPTPEELQATAAGGSERSSGPLLQKDVEYAITFDYDGRRRTLPTNQRVYREAAKAFADEQALELTYGPNQDTVGAARRIANFEL